MIQRNDLTNVTLWVRDGRAPRLEDVTRCFPSISVEPGEPTDGPSDLDQSSWDAPDFDFWGFDRALDNVVASGGPLRLSSAAAPAARFLRQVLTRGQRCARARNSASREPWFDDVLAAHASLHDLSLPLVRADYDHALDCWQWCLRLEAEASAAAQLAALLHDIERLSSEPERRIEHHASDYAAFKREHAARGAEVAAELLARCAVPAPLRQAVADLVAHSEAPRQDAESQLVNDADALSFFSLNSPGFVDHYPPEHTRAKVRYTLDRMSERAQAEIASLRLRDELRALLPML